MAFTNSEMLPTDTKRKVVKKRYYVNPPVVLNNPFATLTYKEKCEMSSNWKIIRKDIPGNAQLIFYTFFSKFPQYMTLFSAFKTMTLEQVHHDPKLQAHANTVVYFLTGIVDNIFDPGCLVMMLLKTARNHRRDNVPLKSFQDFLGVVMEVLAMRLGPKLKPIAASAWLRMFEMIIQTITVGMETDSSGSYVPPLPPQEPGH